MGIVTFGDGGCDLNLQFVEQLVERSQTRAITDAIMWCLGGGGGGCPIEAAFKSGRVPLPDVLDAIEAVFDSGRGLDGINPGQRLGTYSRPRRAELAAALNRLRILQYSAGGV